MLRCTVYDVFWLHWCILDVVLSCMMDKRGLEQFVFLGTGTPSELQINLALKRHGDNNSCIKMQLTGDAVLLFRCHFRRDSDGFAIIIKVRQSLGYSLVLILQTV